MPSYQCLFFTFTLQPPEWVKTAKCWTWRIKSMGMRWTWACVTSPRCQSESWWVTIRVSVIVWKYYKIKHKCLVGLYMCCILEHNAAMLWLVAWFLFQFVIKSEFNRNIVLVCYPQQALFTKATVVDLSCNNITSLPVSTNINYSPKYTSP